jgi:GDPmannose 4,6-dehydratase
MKILITGISGQDGIFLTKLIRKEYSNFNIVGTSRTLTSSQFLEKIGISELKENQVINTINLNLENEQRVSQFISDFSPNMVFNLTGPSSVNESIKNPVLANKITKIFDNLTNGLLKSRNLCNFYQASTSEMYGLNNKLKIYDETSEFIPNSPYASGKLLNHKKVNSLRNNYNWNIYSGIMFNHESEYRKDEFLFMKIITTAYKIKKNRESKLKLGSLEYCRDWSYAGDLVEGIMLLTKEGVDFDYVLGSGVGTKIEQLVEIIFNLFDLDYKNYVEVDDTILRTNDPKVIISNPNKIYKEFGWKTKHTLENFVEIVVKNLNL